MTDKKGQRVKWWVEGGGGGGGATTVSTLPHQLRREAVELSPFTHFMGFLSNRLGCFVELFVL